MKRIYVHKEKEAELPSAEPSKKSKLEILLERVETAERRLAEERRLIPRAFQIEQAERELTASQRALRAWQEKQNTGRAFQFAPSPHEKHSPFAGTKRPRPEPYVFKTTQQEYMEELQRNKASRDAYFAKKKLEEELGKKAAAAWQAEQVEILEALEQFARDVRVHGFTKYWKEKK